MTGSSKYFNFYIVIKSLSYAMDLISEALVGHHKKVAYISLEMGKEMGMSYEKIKKLVISALIHDLGIFYLKQNYSDLGIDNEDNRHAEIGYMMLKRNFPGKDIAEIVRYHHDEWDKNENNENTFLSNILHFADRVSVLINRDNITILNQRKGIMDKMNEISKDFYPALINVFKDLDKREVFWLDVISNERIERKIDSFFQQLQWRIGYNELIEFSYLISHIIDFRSSFTATHSAGISATSSLLGRYHNFNKIEQKTMMIAGYLHDLGKLIVPPEVLNKRGKLTQDEWNIMKTHTYYTYQALSTSNSLKTIRDWASFHHEKLNGRGYPFHLKRENLSLGSKIMAVADVFTAITEDRPYRKGMDYSKARRILSKMGEDDELDDRIVGIILDNFREFNEIREKKQNETKRYFDQFNKKTKNLFV